MGGLAVVELLRAKGRRTAAVWGCLEARGHWLSTRPTPAAGGEVGLGRPLGWHCPRSRRARG